MYVVMALFNVGIDELHLLVVCYRIAYGCAVLCCLESLHCLGPIVVFQGYSNVDDVGFSTTDGDLGMYVCACMCMFMHVCVCACMTLCVYVWVRVGMCVCVCVSSS